jgi:hypothetical protein
LNFSRTEFVLELSGACPYADTLKSQETIHDSLTS